LKYKSDKEKVDAGFVKVLDHVIRIADKVVVMPQIGKRQEHCSNAPE